MDPSDTCLMHYDYAILDLRYPYFCNNNKALIKNQGKKEASL
jgi:hypothetical protein